MTEILDSRRLALVSAAQQRWIAALTDLGGRNTLLYYKDRRAATLDLAQADPEALDRFTRTGSIRLTRLFKDVDVRADAIRRVQAIHRKARELLEERGIRAGYLATGMARWDELFLEPAAPVLLRGLTITPTRARYDDFELILDDEQEVNPVLVHKLASVFGARAGPGLTPENAFDRLLRARPTPPRCRASRSPAARSSAPSPTPSCPWSGTWRPPATCWPTATWWPRSRATRTRRNWSRPTVSAAATIPTRPRRTTRSWTPTPPSATRSTPSWPGSSLVIHGPPGTGKSQTIANLIAALVAHGRKVLFVAEKRAAIDAVLSRLKGVGPRRHGAGHPRGHQGPAADRPRPGRDARPGQPGRHAGASGACTAAWSTGVRRLSRHVSALHEVHEPWGLTPFRSSPRCSASPRRRRTPVRLPAPERLDAEAAETIRDELREFAHLGGFTLRPSEHPVVRRRCSAPPPTRSRPSSWPARWTPRRCRCSRTGCEELATQSGLRRRPDYAEAGQAHAPLRPSRRP